MRRDAQVRLSRTGWHSGCGRKRACSYAMYRSTATGVCVRATSAALGRNTPTLIRSATLTPVALIAGLPEESFKPWKFCAMASRRRMPRCSPTSNRTLSRRFCCACPVWGTYTRCGTRIPGILVWSCSPNSTKVWNSCAAGCQLL